MLPKAAPAMRGHAKGTLLVNLKAYVERRHGAAAWPALLDRVSPADRQILDGMVLLGGWYPVGAWNRIVDAHLSHASNAKEEMTAYARFTADRDLNSVFKALLRMGSPSFVLSRTDSLWRRYFDAGELKPKQVSPREFALTLEAPADLERAAGPWVCQLGVCGWLAQALELTGAKQPEVEHLRCRFQGAPCCEYRARW
jgi:hypothetical protein